MLLYIYDHLLTKKGTAICFCSKFETRNMLQFQANKNWIQAYFYKLIICTENFLHCVSEGNSKFQFGDLDTYFCALI